MNDQDQTHGEPGFDDPSYDDLRALLAEYRVTELVPEDVAARLDATLASLTGDRHVPAPVPTPAAEVLPLRRPSRTAPRLLAAAAAVVLLGGGGVALSQVLGHQDSRVTADSAVAGSTTDGVPGPALTSAPDQAATPGTTSPEAVRGVGPQLQVVPEFTRSGFAAQAASYRVAVGTSDSVADGEGTAGSPAPTPAPTRAATASATAPPTAKELPAPYGADYCPGPTGTDAVIVPINLDGVPAALAVHPVVAGSQLYEAWTCDGTFRITYATVAR